MHSPKRVTERVMAANRMNAKKSTGPKTARGKEASSQGAVRHGLLSKVLRFENDEEKAEYNSLLADLVRELQPQNSIEAILIEEIAVNYCKLQRALGWELASVRARSRATRSLIGLLTGSSMLHSEEKPPLFDEVRDGLDRTSAGWDCEVHLDMNRAAEHSEDSLQLAERSFKDEDRSQRMGSGDEKTNRSRTSVKLSSSLPTVLRYEVMIKRDLYRAMEQLRKLRAED